ncbi:nuclear transport factor 2 family protein [Lichenibacterium minor]|uniref:Nuclear transport factor 2 family protein n=1 Tax=Lichenibacterium minor TaxID=2316528 RepID=A0A4Q2U411_9HYPH|nr:nuclear transport factor 2 family protein [Lichenibacterium minor]RYC31279.1 nuclear transport factor 2 family protein [Lichenibacterium minor]
MKTASLALVPLALAALSAPAVAGPAADMAQAHIAAIAKGDVAAVMASTAPGATLHWIGGPLDGTYASVDAQKPVWTKFTSAQGDQKATVSDLSEAANPKGATVTANVVFAGKNAVKVRYVMLYTDGKLVDEIWQVDPNGKY